MIIICTIITIPILTRKLFLAILCRKTIMPSKAPKLPPKKVKSNKVISDILRLCCLANNLSAPYTKNVTVVVAKNKNCIGRF